MHIQCQDPSRNLTTRILQRRATGRHDLQITTQISQTHCNVATQARTRMALTHLQTLPKNTRHKTEDKNTSKYHLDLKTFAG